MQNSESIKLLILVINFLVHTTGTIIYIYRIYIFLTVIFCEDTIIKEMYGKHFKKYIHKITENKGYQGITTNLVNTNKFYHLFNTTINLLWHSIMHFV